MTPEDAYHDAEKWHKAYGVVPPELEEVIATDPWISYMYASILMRGRFELGEPIIATHSRYSYWYASNIINSRFELGESAIMTNDKIKDMYDQFVQNL